MLSAVISDVHGNLEALNAVLADAREEGATRVICLGDMVVYGPDPIECVRRSREFDVTVAGEMDCSLLNPDSSQWNPTFVHEFKRLRAKFEREGDWHWLEETIRNYQTQLVEGSSLFVHGRPTDRREYFFPEHVYLPEMLNQVATQFDELLFSGSSHIAGLLIPSDEGDWKWIQGESENTHAISENTKTICTVGSVGQPRDGDWRAAYVLWDGKSIRFRRVEYNKEMTKRKIYDDPDSMDLHGDRLDRGH